MNTREAIKATTDGFEREPVTAFGQTIYVGSMTSKQKDAFDLESSEGTGNHRARLAVIVCENEDGSPVFEPADAEWLGEKSWRETDKIFRAAVNLNGMLGDPVKNSNPAPSDSSPTDSQPA
jgi:hypothetical protein